MFIIFSSFFQNQLTSNIKTQLITSSTLSISLKNDQNIPKNRSNSLLKSTQSYQKKALLSNYSNTNNCNKKQEKVLKLCVFVKRLSKDRIYFILGTFFWSLSRLFSKTQVFFKAAFLTRLRIKRFCWNSDTQVFWAETWPKNIYPSFLPLNKFWKKRILQDNFLTVPCILKHDHWAGKQSPAKIKQNLNRSQTVIILHAWVVFCRRIFIKNKSSLEKGASDRHGHLTMQVVFFTFLRIIARMNLSYFDNLGTNSLIMNSLNHYPAGSGQYSKLSRKLIHLQNYLKIFSPLIYQALYFFGTKRANYSKTRYRSEKLLEKEVIVPFLASLKMLFPTKSFFFDCLSKNQAQQGATDRL